MSGNSGRCWGYCGVDGADRAHRRHTLERAEVLLGERLAGHDQRGRAVGGRADVEQPQRVGHHRAGQHVLDASFLAVAGIRVVQAVPGVLDLHLRRSPRRWRRRGPSGGAPAARSRPGSSRRSGGSAASPGRSCVRRRPARSTLRGGVGADHQRDVAEAGQDLRAGALQRLRAAGAGGVARADRDAVPAELLGERRRPRRSRGSRCGWCRRRRRAGSGASPGRPRPARRGRRRRRTR